MTDEEKVCSVWGDVILQWERVEGKRYVTVFCGDRALPLRGYTTATRAMLGAVAYTDQVLEEARQIREEMTELGRFPKRAWVNRTLARLQTLYAAHVRGIKPKALK